MLLLFVKLKEEITGKTGKDGTKNVDVMGPDFFNVCVDLKRRR